MAPLSKSSEADNRDGCMISDSWYIGAFGKWWRGGVLEAWYQDVIARTKDEESWSSGILSIKRLDIFPEYNGMWFIIYFFFNIPIFSFQGPPSLQRTCRLILHEDPHPG